MNKKSILLIGLIALALIIIFCVLFKLKTIQSNRMTAVESTQPLDQNAHSAVKDTLAREKILPSPDKIKKQINAILTQHTISFESGTTSIDERGKEVLDRIYRILKQRPTLKLTIIGHTDSSGNETHNNKLSTMRALAVMNYLKNKGLDKVNYTVRGVGSSQPVAGNDTARGRMKNRRVEIILEGE